MENTNYIVYVHINTINGKLYIGITCKKPIQRWGKNGCRYNGTYFGRAIKKYGWENFKHIVLIENLTQQVAFEIEKYLIEKYQTRNEKYGYNLSVGGGHGSTGYLNNSLSKQVFCYSIDGEYLDEYPSAHEAERQTGITASVIIRCCKGKSAYSDQYRWSYEKYEKLEPLDIKQYIYEKVHKLHRKKVYQYTKDRKILLNEFDSLSIAGEVLNINYKNISACCTGRYQSTHGFYFSYTPL